MNYVTITQVKQVLRRSSTDTNEDQLFAILIEWSSRFVEWYKGGRRFDVRVETGLFDAPIETLDTLGVFDQFSSSRARLRRKQPALKLEEDLLEVIELLNGGGDEILDYLLEPARSMPKSAIRLKSGSWELSPEGNAEQAISLTGVFGYVPEYHSSFVKTGETLGAELAPGVTTIDLDNIQDVALDGIGPRIQAGQLLRLHFVEEETDIFEYLYVVSTSVGTGSDSDSMVVVRGYNGTTAETFPSGTEIEVFRPWSVIVQSVLRLVQWRYQQKDAGDFDKQYFAGTGVMSIPANLPPDVYMTLGPRGRPSL